MINSSKTKTPALSADPQKRINNFNEVELGFNDKSALQEALRCLNCKARPCVSGCPVGVKIPEFIGFIKSGDISAAYKTITESNSFPAICGRVCPQEKQCEARCVRGKTGEPVAIGCLERYVADKNADIGESMQKIECFSKKDCYKVAIVGSGPSGLACASELAKKGVSVTVYEALHFAGGVLSYGIPEFRLPESVLSRELQNLKSMGVRIITNVVVGKTITIDDLFAQGYKAVYISSGAGLPRFMNIPGEGAAGVYSANEFLTRINLMKAYNENYDTPINIPGKVLVTGGGNVAMDAARCARRLGNAEVTVMYRRSESEMPARRAEILHAKEEGIKFEFLSTPTEFLHENGKVFGAKCIKMKKEGCDNSGRSAVASIPGSEFEVKADTVIIAIGNMPNTLIKNSQCKIDFDSRGKIITQNNSTRTSRPFVYAGGDAVTGAATVILAMGAGKLAAKEIVKDLKI